MKGSEGPIICGIGHARAVWCAPAADRITWTRWLKGSAAVLVSVTAVGLLVAMGSTARPLEATAQMEQLARKLEHARTVHPDTASTIAKLISQPWYDCTQIACNSQLQRRNESARARLKAISLNNDLELQTAGASDGGGAIVRAKQTRREANASANSEGVVQRRGP
jgi:hypothetical protein